MSNLTENILQTRPEYTDNMTAQQNWNQLEKCWKEGKAENGVEMKLQEKTGGKSVVMETHFEDSELKSV